MDNYERKYKDALRRAQKLYEHGTITESLGWVFPEIKESKDERIRKTLIAFFRDWERTKSHCWNVNVTDIIAWLEKQREKQHSHIDVNKMVDEFAHTEIDGYGVPSMVEVDAYRRGIEDALKYCLTYQI